MEALREWIWQIAGIIVLSVVCDMIMPSGSMQKYVRLVMGLILVIAVVNPIVGISGDTISFLNRTESRQSALEFKNQLSEREQFNVLKIYREKICQNIENELKQSQGIIADVKVEIEEKDKERFGNLNDVAVIIHSQNQNNEVESDVKNTLNKKFGIVGENIRVLILHDKKS